MVRGLAFLTAVVERTLPGPFGQRVVALLRQDGTAGTAAKGSIAALVVAAVGILISFVVQASLTRTLGTDEYGTYSAVLAFMNLALPFTKIELDIVTTRFVGAYAATGQWGRLRGLLSVVRRRVFWRTVLATLVGGGVLLALRGSRFDHSIPAALVALPLFVLTAQLSLRGAALQGFKRVVEAQVPNVVLRPALFLVTLWLTVALGFASGAASAVAYNAVATLAAILIADHYLRGTTPTGVREAAAVSEWKEWRRAGHGLIFITAAQLLLSDGAGVLLVAFLLGRTNSAFYNVASQLAIFVAFATTAVMFIAAPLIAELYAKQQLDTLRRFARAITTVCLLASLTLLIGITAFGRPLLGVFGASYTVAYPALVLLAVSHFVSASIGALAGWLMTMTGHERAAAWMIGSSGLLQIALAIPLTRTYGIVGTAAATLVAVLTRSLMLSVFLRRRLGIVLMPVFPLGPRA